MQETRIPLEGTDAELVLINFHLEAYDDGDGKIAQSKMLAEKLSKEYEAGTTSLQEATLIRPLKEWTNIQLPTQKTGFPELSVRILFLNIFLLQLMILIQPADF